MGFFGDYLSGKVIQCLEIKIKENSWYQKLTGNILINSSANSELNQLLEESIKVARINKIVAELQDDEIKFSIDKNIDIISDCIVLSKDNFPLSNFIIRIKYNNNNEEHCKQVETFYKSLYEQIQKNKQNYPTLQNNQILSELGNIREEMTGGFSNIDTKLDRILFMNAITDYEKITYNDELTAIENKIKIREFTIAREMALNIEKIINKNNKPEEIEKLYALIINTFLLEGGKQEESLKYFDNLIAHTQDNKKKKARSILRQIIGKDFNNAQIELDKIFKSSNTEEIDSLFYENQINLYFLSGNFDDGYKFIIDNKIIINNYQYFLALMLIQQRKFVEAKNLMEEHKDFFNNNSDFEIQEIKILIRSHALLLELRKTTTIEIINELKSLPVEIKALIDKAGDCKTKISYLHSVNAIILAAIFEKEAAKNEYKKALELDPNNYNVHKNYPYLLLDNYENLDQALSLIQKYLEKYTDSLDDKLLYYSILTELNPKKVINEILEKKDIEIELKIYLVHALDNINQHTEAENRLNEMLDKHNNCFSVHFCAGVHHIKLNKPILAIESFIKAYSLCKNETHFDSVFFYLLSIVCNEHYIDKMITIKNWLEMKYDRSIILLKYSQYYIHILLVLEDFQTCIICCNELRENNNDDYIAIAEFTCYYNTKNFQKVKEVLDENRIKYSNEILVRLAYACASIGDYDLTKEILKKLKKPENKEEYIIIARLFFSIKEYQDSLKTIHSAYKNYPNDRNIQEFFIKLVYGHHIYPQTDDIANSFSNCLQSYRVAKYDNKIIQEISIPKDTDGEGILEIITKHFPKNHNIDKRIELIYKNRLPISLYKSIFNKTLFSIHDMVIHSTNLQIWCTEIFENDLDHIRISPVYIDLSSLITLELLDLLDIIKQLFPKIYFTQSTLDEILLFDNELSEPFCEHVIIYYGKHDDLISRKSHKEIIIDMQNRIKEIKSFVLSGDNIQIIGTVLNPKNNISKNINDFLENYKKTDTSESDTMCFSYLADCQAMIENVALRAAFNTFKNSPLSFGIDSLLKYLFNKSLISEKIYFISLTILIENNYRQIPISVKHMLFIIRYEGYTIQQKHSKLFNYFASQEFDFENTVEMLAYLLSHIWNEIPPSDKRKGEWSDYLLGIIALNPLMNDKYKYKILYYVRTHIITKQNNNSFTEYLKSKMLTSKDINT